MHCLYLDWILRHSGGVFDAAEVRRYLTAAFRPELTSPSVSQFWTKSQAFAENLPRRTIADQGGTLWDMTSKKLEHALENLNRRVTELHGIALEKQMLPIIHRPGFTTPAEFSLVMNAVESMTHAVENQIHQSKQLLDAAGKIRPIGTVTTAA